jgi:hypothetical protein
MLLSINLAIANKGIIGKNLVIPNRSERSVRNLLLAGTMVGAPPGACLERSRRALFEGWISRLTEQPTHN